MNKIAKKTHFYRTYKESYKILGIRVDLLSLKTILSLAEKWVKSNKKYQISTPNPEHIILANKDYGFKKVINNSQLAIPDGVGVIWAAKLLNCSIFDFFKVHSKFQRLSGVDLMKKICNLAALKKWRVFLLGGKENIVVQVAQQLKIDNPKLKINYFSGAIDISKETEKEKNETIKKINEFKPHFLFVAYGAPNQEKWIAKNLSKLNVKVAMGVGGAFDYLAGKIKRAPLWLRKIGGEWFWRLLNQPWRWRRQLALGKFVYLVVKEKILG